MSRKAYDKLLTKIDQAFDEWQEAIGGSEDEDWLLVDASEGNGQPISYGEWFSWDDEQVLDNEESPSNPVTETSGFDPVTESSGYDPVTDPVQYHIGGIETIDIMRIVLTREEFKGYLKGNIIKYRERAMHKGKAEEDWAKAREYKRIYTIEFGHTDMSELKDEFDNGVGVNYWNGVLLGTQGDSRPRKEYRW